jgi:hypothetical protein
MKHPAPNPRKIVSVEKMCGKLVILFEDGEAGVYSGNCCATSSPELTDHLS